MKPLHRWVVTILLNALIFISTEPPKSLHLLKGSWFTDFSTDLVSKYHLHGNHVAELFYSSQSSKTIEACNTSTGTYCLQRCLWNITRSWFITAHTNWQDYVWEGHVSCTGFRYVIINILQLNAKILHTLKNTSITIIKYLDNVHWWSCLWTTLNFTLKCNNQLCLLIKEFISVDSQWRTFESVQPAVGQHVFDSCITLHLDLIPLLVRKKWYY